MKNLIFLIATLFLRAMTLSAQFIYTPQPTVYTSSGEIRGTYATYGNSSLQVYYGIPYALPPIGDLRFRSPVPVSPWLTPLQATELPLACVQYVKDPYPWKDFNPNQDEDCLYLNVFVPNYSLGNFKKAVMFFTHGGSYITGSSRMPTYDARALAVEGDVIVVTFNYRVGVLGFLYASTPDAAGNAGFRDTVEALKWVNKNIEFFGGDKERITVFGSSAGAMSTGLLTISPKSNTLFKRAILQGASPALYFSNLKKNVEEIGQQVADAVGCTGPYGTLNSNPTEVVKCLRGIDPLELQKASSFATGDKFVWFPIHDDDVFPYDSRQATAYGDFKNVDILIGGTRDEGSFFLTTYDPEKFGFFGYKNAYPNRPYAVNFMQKFYGEFPGASRMIDYYTSLFPEQDNHELRRTTYAAAGDFLFFCPVVYFAEKFAEKGNRVYFYYLTHRPSTSVWAPWMGVAHGEEVEYVFGLPLLHPGQYSDVEYGLSRQIIDIWSNFAKTGDPGYDWPYYSRENPEVFLLCSSKFGNISRAHSEENCNVMRSFYGF